MVEIFVSKMQLSYLELDEKRTLEGQPELNKQLSTQLVFKIHAFEVRDKLAISEINKLLHLYTNRRRWVSTKSITVIHT